MTVIELLKQQNELLIQQNERLLKVLEAFANKDTNIVVNSYNGSQANADANTHGSNIAVGNNDTCGNDNE